MTIKEFLPNPTGKDTEGEYIVLLNNNEQTINLAGWSIKDSSGKVFKLDSHTLAPNEELKLFYTTTKIALNNDGETIFLITPAGQIADELGFTGAIQEGAVVSRSAEASHELKAELLETFPSDEPGGNLALDSQIFLLMILTGIILAGLTVWILRKFPKTQDEKTS